LNRQGAKNAKAIDRCSEMLGVIRAFAVPEFFSLK
jgi:hypothetical protein